MIKLASLRLYSHIGLLITLFQSENSFAFNVFKSYHVDLNQDGSITFTYPNARIKGRRGNYRYFNIVSDPLSLCQKLGDFNLAIEFVPTEENHLGWRVNSSGEIESTPVSGLSYKRITCRNSQYKIPISSKYKKLLKNKDGTITILEPRFVFEGSVRKISANHSSLDGVCAHFGMWFHVSNNIHNHYAESKARLVSLDDSGFLIGYSPNARGNLRIQSISCIEKDPELRKNH